MKPIFQWASKTYETETRSEYTQFSDFGRFAHCESPDLLLRMLDGQRRRTEAGLQAEHGLFRHISI